MTIPEVSRVDLFVIRSKMQYSKSNPIVSACTSQHSGSTGLIFRTRRNTCKQTHMIFIECDQLTSYHTSAYMCQIVRVSKNRCAMVCGHPSHELLGILGQFLR